MINTFCFILVKSFRDIHTILLTSDAALMLEELQRSYDFLCISFNKREMHHCYVETNKHDRVHCLTFLPGDIILTSTTKLNVNISFIHYFE